MKRPYGIAAALCAMVVFALSLISLGIRAGEEKKTIRIVYSNDLLGYTEPCGCGGHKEGGLPRRATLISQLVEENPNTVLIDSGNLSNTPVKLKVITEVLSQLHYDALGVGSSDLRFADAFFKRTSDENLTVLDASPGARESTKPYIIKSVDGVKVGIVSFGAVAADKDAYSVRRSLYSAYKSARDKSDILIVLDQSNTVDQDWLERNGPRLGSPDIVVGGVSNMTIRSPVIVGRAHICPTSYKGKKMGIADIQFVKGEDPRVDIRVVELDTSVPEDEVVKKLVAGDSKKSTVASVRKPAGRVAGVPKAAIDRQPYYPPQLCKTCHIEEYEDWVQTDHAKAIKTLVGAERTISECLTCHSEMYRRLGQWASTADGIGGVECATCHLDSLPHGMERLNIKRKTKVNPKLCLDCHNKERSPDYDEKTYFPATTHGAVQSTKTAHAGDSKSY